MATTTQIARALGADAANKQMRADGRIAWSKADCDLAAKTMMRLLGEPA